MVGLYDWDKLKSEHEIIIRDLVNDTWMTLKKYFWDNTHNEWFREKAFMALALNDTINENITIEDVARNTTSARIVCSHYKVVLGHLLKWLLFFARNLNGQSTNIFLSWKGNAYLTSNLMKKARGRENVSQKMVKHLHHHQ